MRVLIVSQYFWPENFRVNEVAAGLAARGHTVVTLTGAPNYPEGALFPEFAAAPAQFARLGAVEIVRVPILPRGKGSARLLLNYLSFVVSGALIGAWKLRGRKFDAIFMFETSPITSALPAILLRRLKRAPMLMWVLDLWPETLSAVGAVRSPVLLGMVGALVRFIYRRTDRILIQSRAFAANIECYADDPAKLRYFPAWADIMPEVPVAAAEMAPFAANFTILFAGNIGAAQDFPAVLDAVEALHGQAALRWVIVGSGRAEAELHAEIQRRALDDRVVLLGRFPAERMPSFFAAADALLVSLARRPIFAMTIPGKLQSYLAAGRPVLAMLDGEGARIIEAAGAGLTVPAGDGAALAGAVRRLMALDGAVRGMMGASGRAYAAREFDRERLLDQLAAWMDEAAA